MVKMLFFLKRRPEISRAEFHRYWSDQHGPLFSNSAVARRYIIRYEQNHTAPENAEIDGLDFDGFSVMWLRSVDDVHASEPIPSIGTLWCVMARSSST
jgi:hypothetical protein